MHGYQLHDLCRFLRFLQIWRIKKRVCATLLPFEFSGATRADEAGETKSGSI